MVGRQRVKETVGGHAHEIGDLINGALKLDNAAVRSPSKLNSLTVPVSCTTSTFRLTHRKL